MIAVIDREGTRHPLEYTIPFHKLISIERLGELFTKHRIPRRDRAELVRAIYDERFDVTLRDDRHRRFWDEAFDEMMTAVDTFDFSSDDDYFAWTA